MSLKSEMVKNSWTEIEDFIDIDKAIEIAEKYAEEMCRKQREICKEHWENNWRDFEDHGGIIMDDAPLATDVKDETPR